jgi:predicted transcriptional regulator
MYVELDGPSVRAKREEQGMTKRDLAAAAGVSATTARKAESGEPDRARRRRR